MEYGDYKILNNKVESSPGIEKTTLELIKKGEDEKRIITHILYSGWPDHGAPKEEGMEFIDQILLFIKVSLKTNPTGKIITHCRYISYLNIYIYIYLSSYIVPE